MCNGECNERCFDDYAGFPYCTACMSEVALFTGTTYYEEIVTGMSQLENLLQEKGKVLLDKGDYITITLKKDGTYKSILQSVTRMAGKEENVR